MTTIKPHALKEGDTIGIFTPSSPSYIYNEELFLNGIRNLEEMGFKVKLGSLTRVRSSQGYRSATPKERAMEFMELINDDSVDALMSTIGGDNSSSLIPYLDFEMISKKRKIFCGYSDVTSLHLAILKYSNLSTIYGPALMTWLGEWPNGIEETTYSFIQAVTNTSQERIEVKPFSRWSNHRRDWSNGDWKNLERIWNKSEGWNALRNGVVKAPMISVNLNTLMSCAGTDFFPDLKGKILMIEEMDAPFSREERSLRHLQLMGVFNEISGLIMGRPEYPDNEGAPFTLEELLLEVVGDIEIPIVTNFDCSHCVPMLSLAQDRLFKLEASSNGVYLEQLETFVS